MKKKEREKVIPVVKIPRPEGKSRLEAAEEYFGCKETDPSELPEEEPSEEYLIDFE